MATAIWKYVVYGVWPLFLLSPNLPCFLNFHSWFFFFHFIYRLHSLPALFRIPRIKNLLSKWLRRMEIHGNSLQHSFCEMNKKNLIPFSIRRAGSRRNIQFFFSKRNDSFPCLVVLFHFTLITSIYILLVGAERERGGLFGWINARVKYKKINATWYSWCMHLQLLSMCVNWWWLLYTLQSQKRIVLQCVTVRVCV